MSLAAPRSTMEMPTVTMMSVTRGALRSGRMVRRSISRPMMATLIAARAIARASGRWATVRKVWKNSAPSTTNSPWAKLMMPVAL